MLPIFLHHLARNRGQIIGWAIGMIIMGLLVVPLYDTIVAEAAQIQRLIKGMPPQMLALFADPDLDITSPIGYLSARYFSLATLILSIFVIMGGSGLIASDEENGTLDLLQGHPISRTTLFTGRLLAFVTTLILILALAWLGVILPAGSSQNLNVSAGALARPFVSLLAVLLLFGTLALLFSMLFPSRRMAAMTTGILFIGSYFVTAFAELDAKLAPIARFSPLSYYQSGKAIDGLNGGWLAGLLLVAALFSLLAWWRYERRDIRVAGEGGWQLPNLRRRLTH